MTSVASKNLYELLGNDPELDPDREPEPPTKVADRPAARTGKRNGPSEGPVRDAKPATGGRRQDNFTGSEQAIRDKAAGASNNRAKPTDDGVRQDRHPNRTREPNEHRDIGGRGRSSRGGQGYGARGMRGTRTGRDDRHSRTNIGDQEKQAARGWGAETGEGEFEAETGGLADAHAEEKKEGIVSDEAVVDENGTAADQLPAEPEDNTKSYEQYLAEQLEKKAALNDRPLAARQANEGSSKKFPEGKAFARDDNEDFISGAGAKAKRERERKAKQVVDIDQTWVESESAPRGGRDGERGGRGRGGRGRGEGGRGRGEGGRGRGEFRGRGDRGGRGGRGGEGRGGRGGQGINLTDSSAFPSLGGS